LDPETQDANATAVNAYHLFKMLLLLKCGCDDAEENVYGLE
jgi:hypothetical protein